MEPVYLGDLQSSISNYQNIFYKYEKGLRKAGFHKEPIGEDSIYPDW